MHYNILGSKLGTVRYQNTKKNKNVYFFPQQRRGKGGVVIFNTELPCTVLLKNKVAKIKILNKLF
jgi:hypothetical protein